MKILTDSLGEEGAKRFLEFSLPHIQQRNSALLACLSVQDWQQAAAQAHSIKGTVNLYGSPDLLEHLDKIIRKDIEHIHTPHFTDSLKQQLSTTEEEIINYLSSK
jgi:hypothetical protein